MQPSERVRHVPEPLVSLLPPDRKQHQLRLGQPRHRRLRERARMGRRQPRDLVHVDAVRKDDDLFRGDTQQARHVRSRRLVGRDYAVGQARRLARERAQARQGQALEAARLVLLHALRVHHERRAQQGVLAALPPVAERGQALRVHDVHLARPDEARRLAASRFANAG